MHALQHQASSQTLSQGIAEYLAVHPHSPSGSIVDCARGTFCDRSFLRPFWCRARSVLAWRSVRGGPGRYLDRALSEVRREFGITVAHARA
jgi:hypothetical protein